MNTKTGETVVVCHVYGSIIASDPSRVLTWFDISLLNVRTFFMFTFFHRRRSLLLRFLLFVPSTEQYY